MVSSRNSVVVNILADWKKSYKALENERIQPDIVSPKLHFDYEKFATSQKEFKVWFDYLFEFLPFPTPVTSTVIGVLVFLAVYFYL